MDRLRTRPGRPDLTPALGAAAIAAWLILAVALAFGDAIVRMIGAA